LRAASQSIALLKPFGLTSRLREIRWTDRERPMMRSLESTQARRDESAKYPEYTAGQRDAHRLFMRGAHKALDIPEDMGDINANRIGITWKELAAVGAIALAAWGIYRSTSQPAVPVTPPAAIESQQSIEPIRGKIRFWAEDGTEINPTD